MKTLEDQLSNYAAYHRDARNIRTHFIGIPMIVVAITILLSRPTLDIGGWTFAPALLTALAAGIYYLMLDLALGLLMAVLLLAACLAGAWSATLPTGAWLALGLGGFVLGWVFQFVGHFWEGRKPAFVDDIAGLIIGPLFVVVEALFLLGMLPRLRATIEQRAGKVRHGLAGERLPS